jgi:hypothetical protein
MKPQDASLPACEHEAALAVTVHDPAKVTSYPAGAGAPRAAFGARGLSVSSGRGVVFATVARPRRDRINRELDDRHGASSGCGYGRATRRHPESGRRRSRRNRRRRARGCRQDLGRWRLRRRRERRHRRHRHRRQLRGFDPTDLSPGTQRRAEHQARQPHGGPTPSLPRTQPLGLPSLAPCGSGDAPLPESAGNQTARGGMKFGRSTRPRLRLRGVASDGLVRMTTRPSRT